MEWLPICKLEQLEHLRSEDTFPPTPHDYPYYWPVHIGSQAQSIDQFILDPKAHTINKFILDPKSKQDKVKVTNLKNLPKP